MELRRLAVCLAMLVLAVLSQSSEARHSIHRRATDDYDDLFLNDEGNDDGAQNDADGGNDADEEASLPEGTILSAPTHYQVKVGMPVTLECRVDPPTGVVIQWSKQGQSLFMSGTRMNGPSRYTIANGTSNLLITSAELEDSGKYNCTLLQDNLIFIEHTVSVVQPPNITRFSASNNGVVKEGSELLLTCDVAGSPKPQIVWSRERNGGNENLTEKDGSFSTNTFFVSNVTSGMAGTYYCYAFNTLGHDVSNVSVVVHEKPRVHVHRTVVNTDVGVEAEMQCSAHEQPTPHFRWYKNDMLLEDSSVKYRIDTDGSRSTLNVIPQSDDDFGTFTCQAENVHGSHSKSIDLVQSPVVEDLDAEGPKLSWTIHSHQPLEDIELHLRKLEGDSEWTTVNVPLPAAERIHDHEYNVIYLIPNEDLESGEYEAVVKVKNNKSWSKHTDPAVVKIANDPQPFQVASVFRGSAHSIQSTTVLSTALMYLLVRML